MGDPDFQGGRAGHPDPEIRGARSPKKFFQPFRPQFGLKVRALPHSPGSATGVCAKHSHIVSMLLIIWKEKTIIMMKICLCPRVKSSLKTLLH